MTTKTDRILGYLPPTFRAVPPPTALYSVVDAFGTQLLEAENTLSSVMMAHWVDYADHGSEFIADLNCFASLYGLAPRGSAKDVVQFATPTCPPVSADETVEQFREHLKRYVRTFIEGTVTVQGILRIVAESLALHIADDYSEMDTWWNREGGLLTTAEPHPESVARQLFGSEYIEARGSDASSAQVVGRTSLSKGVDLRGGFILRVRVDGGGPVEIDFTSTGGKTTLPDVIAAINKKTGMAIASDAVGRLKLSSPTSGAKSRLDVMDVRGDAAPALLGLRPRTCTGKAGAAATLTGTVDLSHGVDLRAHSRIQLRIDGGSPILVDCGGKSRAKTGLTEIVDAINKAAKAKIARHDGKHVVLVSPVSGPGSGISLASEANDAAEAIFGIPPRSYRGKDAAPARLAGPADLSGGFDLRSQHLLQVSVDGGHPVVVDLWTAAGDLKAVSPSRIRNMLNRELGAGVASDDGRYLSLASTLKGPASRLEVSPVIDTQVRRFVTRAYITDEAAPLIFGFLRRDAQGSPATPSSLHGSVDLSSGIDLRKNHSLRIAVDDLEPKNVDLSLGTPILRGATLGQIVNAINAQTGFGLASHDSSHLILTSATAGARSRIGLEPAGSGDARLLLFGPNRENATGKDPAPATIRGDLDLTRPVSLADRQTLRIAVDGRPSVDINVSGAVPASTFLDEIVAAINRALPGVASATGDDRLLLTSLSAGEASSLELLPLRALELIEYPPSPVDEPVQEVRHGDKLSVNNDGAAESDLQINIVAPQGEAGAQFVDRQTNVRLRVAEAILPGETMNIRRGGPAGVQAEITDVQGNIRTVPDSSVLAGTMGAEVQIPFEGQRPLCLGVGEVATLQLRNPSGASVVVLRAVAPPQTGQRILVSVSPAATIPAKSNPGAGQQNLVGRLRSGADESHLLNESGQPIVRLLAGKAVVTAALREQIVSADGTVHVERDGLPIMTLDVVASLFDVTVQLESTDKPPKVELYAGVTIGAGATPDSLPLSLLRRPSELVRAEEMDKAELLTLSRGRLELTYMNNHASRFDEVNFTSKPFSDAKHPPQANEAQFVGGSAREWPLFETSRFSDVTPTDEAAFFSPASPDPSVQVGLHWTRYQPGAFEVNLPADLSPEFGAHFDQSRFGLSGQKPETYNGVVTEPESDPEWLVHRINARSTLVSASRLPGPVPPGFEPSAMPFEQPRSLPLKGGSPKRMARIYLVEEGVPGVIELQALVEGEWGNSIAVTSKRAGSVRFDITVSYQGARFENARQIALSGRVLKAGESPLPSQSTQLVKAGPVGVVQAKAAGIRVDVTRNRTEVPAVLPTEARSSRLRKTPRPGYPYLGFNGVSSYVEAPDSDQFSVSTTGRLTISAWMRPETLTFLHDERKGYVNWLGKGEGRGPGGKQEWAFRMYSFGTPESSHRPNRISFYVFNPWGGLGIGSYFQDPVDPGEWIHVVGAADGTCTYIYKNGVLRKCDQYRGATDRTCGRHPFIVTPIHGSAPLRMGHVDGNSYFLGGLSEVRLWNRLLTHKEVAGLYGSNRVPRDGLVAEYLLNEGRGEVAHDTAADHDAMIFGAKWK